MAELVLLATSTRARIVPTDFLGNPASTGHRGDRATRTRCGRFTGDLHMEDGVSDVVLHRVKQLFEHPRRLNFVLN